MSLNLYKPLGDNDEATRLAAASRLSRELSILISGERTEKSKSDLDYALKRLTKGLASGRESARPGFAVVLTEFLSALQSPRNPEKWDVNLVRIIEMVKANTHPPGHASGQEIRDYSLGRLFGLQSMLKSMILFRSMDSLEKYADVLDLVFELADKKPWLRESCGWTVVSTVKQLGGDIAKYAAKTTYEKITASGFAKSGEGVGIWLALQAYHPDVAPPEGVWHRECPLAIGNLSKLAKILKESGSKDDVEEKPKGSWSPKLGFVWGFILNVYFPREQRWLWFHDDGRIAAWDQFWTKIVDESLFSSASSEERKYWGFLFFLKSLDHVTTPHLLTYCFSKNFMRCFINQLSGPGRYLHKIAQKTVRVLIAKSESTPWMVSVIFHQLFSNNGTPNFDQITKSKVVGRILLSAHGSGLSEVFKELKGFIMSPIVDNDTPTPKSAEVRRQWAADHLLNMVRSGKTEKPENLLRQLLELFTTLAYFDVDYTAPEVTPASQSMFRARLMSTLTELIGLKGGKLVNGESWPFYAVRTIQNQRAERKWNLAVEFDDIIEGALEEAMASAGEIRRKRSEAFGSAVDIQLLSFEILYSLLILQVFNGESDALSVLDDLKSIQNKILGAEKKKKRAERREADDVDPSEVLVDILLSFLSRQSVLLKKVSHTIFAAFAPFITKTGLERCFDVLATKEGLGGQQELFDEDNSDDAGADSNDDDDDDDDELPSDAEMLDGSDAEDCDLDSDAEILSAFSSDDEDEGGDPHEDAKLDAALREALAPHAPNSDDSDTDASMSDSAMEALDSHLSSIFAARKKAASKKTEKKAAKELILTFKSKALDLLKVYIKAVPCNPVALEILLPCLQLSRRTRDQKLADKAAAVVKSFTHAYNRAPDSGTLPLVTAEERLWELFSAIHEEAGKGGKGGASSSASILVAKVLVRKDPKNLERVASVYASSMAKWALDDSFQTGGFFYQNFIGWVGSIRANLRKQRQEDRWETVKEDVEEEPKGKKGKNKKGRGESSKKSELAVGNPKKRKSEDDEEEGEEEEEKGSVGATSKHKKRKNKNREKSE